MSKIQSLNLSVLRNEEAFGFLQQVQTETKHLTDVTIESIVDNFSVALEEFDKALKESERKRSKRKILRKNDFRPKTLNTKGKPGFELPFLF